MTIQPPSQSDIPQDRIKKLEYALRLVPFGWSIIQEPQEGSAVIDGDVRYTSRLEQLCATFGIPPNMIDKPGSHQ